MSSIGGDELLSYVENQVDPRLGQYLRQYVKTGIETTAFHAGVSPTGEVAPVAPPQSIAVTALGDEHLQVVVNHDAPISKPIRYITHIATNPQFSGAIIHDHGCSRCPPPIFVPTKDSTGATHNFYIATVAQMPGSQPSVTFYGGKTPQPFTMTGTTSADIQAGTGSGTAVNGGQVLVGLGKSQVRQQQPAKRSVNG